MVGPDPVEKETGDPRARRESGLPEGAGIIGMRIFLGSLTVLFVASILGYLLTRSRAATWPPPGVPALPSGLWLSTGVIVACSVTIHLALRAVRMGERSACSRWLSATLGLGLLFLTVQSVNWFALVAAHFTPKTNLYAFLFYMLTVLHALHVVGGLVPLGIVTGKSLAGRYGSGWHPGVTYMAMYWHFLDAVWIVLFLVLYVLG